MSDIKNSALNTKSFSEDQWLDVDDSYFCDDINHVQVACNVVVLNLADIETSNMSYRMRLEMWVAWPLTKDDVKRYIKDREKWKPTIHPDPVPWTITIEQINKMPFLSGHTTQVFIWRGKLVACECTLVTAVYLESMELVNFPFDCQHFNFHIGIRCDCDIPLQMTENGQIQRKTLKSIGGFENFDGRAMAKLKLDPRGCTFNVRTHLLTLKDFKLCNIECEIENMERDIPFLHCSLRMARNYESYVWRIFVPVSVIVLNATFVFRFDAANTISDKLNFLITNLLTVVAFFYILASILPAIAYLTLVDKFMIGSLLYVGSMAAIVVILSWQEVTDPNDEQLAYIFVGLSGLLFFSLFLFACYCVYARGIELKKLTMTRHQVEVAEFLRLKGGSDDKDEFLVHTDINDSIVSTLPNGGKHKVFQGVYRDQITPPEAAGWLFDLNDLAHKTDASDKMNKPCIREVFSFRQEKEEAKKSLLAATISAYRQSDKKTTPMSTPNKKSITSSSVNVTRL